MMYTVNAGQTIELPELPGVYATNADDTAQFIQVVDGVIEVGPEVFTNWTFRVESALIDMPTVKHS